MKWIFPIGAVVLLFAVLQYDNLLVVLHSMDPDHSLPPEVRLLGLAVMAVVITWTLSGIGKSNETIRLAREGQPSPHKHSSGVQLVLLAVLVVVCAVAYLNATGALTPGNW